MIFRIIFIIIFSFSSSAIANWQGAITYSPMSNQAQVGANLFNKLLLQQAQASPLPKHPKLQAASTAIKAGVLAGVKIPINQAISLGASVNAFYTAPTLAGAGTALLRAVPLASTIYMAAWALDAGVSYFNGEFQGIDPNTFISVSADEYIYSAINNYTGSCSSSNNCTDPARHGYSCAVQVTNPVSWSVRAVVPTSVKNSMVASGKFIWINNCSTWHYVMSTSGSIPRPFEPGEQVNPITEQAARERLIASMPNNAGAYDGLLTEMSQNSKLPVPDDFVVSGPESVLHPGYPKTETTPISVTETTKTTPFTYNGDTVTIGDTVTTQTVTLNDNTTQVTETTESNDLENSAENNKIGHCDEYPNTIGCSEYGEIPEVAAMPEIEQPIEYTPISVGTSGSCPADIAMNLSFANITFPLSPVCNFASAVKPFFLIMASLTAIAIVFSTVRD